MKNRKWLELRTMLALAIVALAAVYTPARAFFDDHARDIAVFSLVIGVLFAITAVGGSRLNLLWSPALDKDTLTAVNRAKRILWIWAGFGGAIIVLSLSAREASSLDQAFGMVGFGWMLSGGAALLLESAAFSLEDATEEADSGPQSRGT